MWSASPSGEQPSANTGCCWRGVDPQIGSPEAGLAGAGEDRSAALLGPGAQPCARRAGGRCSPDTTSFTRPPSFSLILLNTSLSKKGAACGVEVHAKKEKRKVSGCQRAQGPAGFAGQLSSATACSPPARGSAWGSHVTLRQPL